MIRMKEKISSCLDIINFDFTKIRKNSKKEQISIFDFRRFVYSFTITFCYAVTARPIGFMILELYCCIMIFMTKYTTTLTNPFRLASFTIIKVCSLSIFPVMSITKNIDLNWYSFYFNILSCQ